MEKNVNDFTFQEWLARAGLGDCKERWEKGENPKKLGLELELRFGDKVTVCDYDQLFEGLFIGWDKSAFNNNGGVWIEIKRGLGGRESYYKGQMITPEDLETGEYDGLLSGLTSDQKEALCGRNIRLFFWSSVG